MPAAVKNVSWRCQQCGKRRWLKPAVAQVRKFCSRECLHASMRTGSPRRGRKKPTYGTRSCAQCGAGYEAKAAHQRFCSQACSIANVHARRVRTDIQARPCEHCSAEFRPRPGSAGRFCSWGCKNAGMKGARAAHFNGGRHVRSSGYVFVLAPDHPNARGKGGYVLEHRLVMEQHLGRLLTSSETVHHRNGDKTDNRIENLELWAGRHPKGTRATEAPHCPTCTCHVH